jgi:ABC-type transport system involved in multi-copper enzyme maturation permease subunit
MSTWVIARLTFREAARRKILWAALILGVAFLVLYGVGVYFIQREIVRGAGPSNITALREMYSFLLMAGLYVVNFLVIMMTVLTSVDTLAGEIASGTIQAVVTKPLRRYEIVLGKWLGFAAMLALYVALMGGGVAAVMAALTRYFTPGLWRGLGLMVLEGLTLLSVCILGGTSLSTLANGVLAFGLYGLAFIGGWIEQIGSLLHNETAVNIGIVSSLFMPSEALWKRAAYEMQSSVSAMIGMSPFASTSVPSPAMIVYAVFYVAVIMALALRRFSRRDL